MWPLEENAKLLVDFGLSLNEAKVFVTVARLGLSSAGEISKASKVRREEVYRVLPKLEEMGLVEKTLDAPFRIKAIPLEGALELLLKRRQEEAAQKMSGLVANVDKLLKGVKTRENVGQDYKAVQFALVSGKRALLSRFSALVAETKRQLDIVTPRKSLGCYLYDSEDELRKATKRARYSFNISIRDSNSLFE